MNDESFAKAVAHVLRDLGACGAARHRLTGVRNRYVFDNAAKLPAAKTWQDVYARVTLTDLTWMLSGVFGAPGFVAPLLQRLPPATTVYAGYTYPSCCTPCLVNAANRKVAGVEAILRELAIPTLAAFKQLARRVVEERLGASLRTGALALLDNHP